MKKILLMSLLVFTGVVATSSAVFSQESMNDFIYTNNTPALVQPIDNAASETNAKVVRTFKKAFSMAEGEKWYKMKHGYSVKFVQDNVEYRVDYDNKGHWSGTLKSYNETKLDRNIRTIVKSVYFDSAIKWVWEISVPDLADGPMYIVHIEDENSFRNIQVFDNEMKTLEQVQK